MKRLSTLAILVFSVLIVRAATTNAPPARVSESLATELPKSAPSLTITPVEPKPNELTIGKTEASGILIEVIKTRPRWKLINPFSPPTNSSPEDNVARDITTGKVTGLKFFAVRF